MTNPRRILVTGCNGFIGRRLVPVLRDNGHQVRGFDRSDDGESWITPVNLLDPSATAAAAARLDPLDAVIHLAALAHGQRPPAGETCLSVNLKLTRHLLSACAPRAPHWVLFSSVAVYGEADRPVPVPVAATPRPSTEYGRSKLRSEELVLAAVRDADILRLAPVFDREHLRDVGKRVFVPGTRWRMRMRPPPSYSLCHVDTVVQRVLAVIARGPDGPWLHHLTDPNPYSQQELAGWFQGPTIPVPLLVLAPLRGIARRLPGQRGYAVRCLLEKLFASNVYAPESRRAQPSGRTA